MAIPPKHDKTSGAPPREVHVENKKTNWLAWAALAAGLLALLIYLMNRSRDDVATTANRTVATSVKAALVVGGIAATRIDTASGGEVDPVDTNTTAGGQAENRRTEVVVLQR